ncbi:MAG: ribosome rescue GTPase HflX, partial [Gammaproteobacteria bacterium]
MFERHQGGERAVLVHIDFDAYAENEERQEFVDLATSAGVVIADMITGKRRTPHPAYLVGTGKAEEIRDCVQAQGADVVLFNHALTPIQERNLEKLCGCRVLDRTGLILDIFAQRARTHEGKLQVELAQLKHLSTRLVRGWTHLERQKGGIGLRGPGETQLETDRRLLGERIKLLNRRLAKVRKQRQQGRRARQRAEVPTVSLVGYTNAGKSTLFNSMTAAGVLAADQLFATLDPTLRRVELPQGQTIILADTVGFIRHLPHDLVASFRSTLQETLEADLLLHVVDAADERRDANIQQVHEVLAEIGADQQPIIEVFNKIDALPQGEVHVDRDDQGRPRRVWLSAQQGQGIELLREVIGEFLGKARVQARLTLPPSAGRLRPMSSSFPHRHLRQRSPNCSRSVRPFCWSRAATETPSISVCEPKSFMA